MLQDFILVTREYNSLDQSLFQTPKDKLTLSYLKSKFSLEDNRKEALKLNKGNRQRETKELANQVKDNNQKNKKKKAQDAESDDSTDQRKCKTCSHFLPKNHPKHHHYCAPCTKIFNDNRQKKNPATPPKSTKSNSVVKKKKKVESSGESATSSCIVSNLTNYATNRWYIDSGCTSHITNNKNELLNAEKSTTTIDGPIGESSTATKIGTVNFYSDQESFGLDNTLYDPNLVRKLMSVKKLCDMDENIRVIFSQEEVKVVRNVDIDRVVSESEQLMYGRVDQTGLYAMKEMRSYECINSSTKIKVVSLLEAHQTLGHPNIEKIKELDRLNLLPFKIKDVDSSLKCTSCDIGKLPRTKFSNLKKRHKTSNVGDIINSDICGKLSIESLGRKNYFISYIDDHSDYTFVKCISKKSEAFVIFQTVRSFVKNQTGLTIKKLLTDGGGEYIDQDFLDYLDEKGIISERTPPNTSQLNGKSERLNRSIC